MPRKIVRCCITGEPIPRERVDVLSGWGIKESEMMSISAAQKVVKPPKMIIVDDQHTHFFCVDASDFGEDLAPEVQREEEDENGEPIKRPDKLSEEEIDIVTPKYKKQKIDYYEDEQ